MGNDPGIALGAGLSCFEAACVSFEQFTGNTANFAAADGEAISRWRALVGLKLWF